MCFDVVVLLLTHSPAILPSLLFRLLCLPLIFTSLVGMLRELGRREHELPTKTLARSLARKWCCRRWTQKRRRCLRRKVSCVAFLHRSLLFGSLALHWYGRGRRARSFPNKDAIIVEALALLFTFTCFQRCEIIYRPNVLAFTRHVPELLKLRGSGRHAEAMTVASRLEARPTLSCARSHVL